MLRVFGFDLSARSRLILAMSAIEQLAPRSLSKGKDYKGAMRELTKALAGMALEPALKDELERGLRGLAFASTRGKCLGLIRTRLGETDVQEFKELSYYRNKVAHEGMSGGDGWSMADRAFDLARRLLFADVEGALHPSSSVGL